MNVRKTVDYSDMFAALDMLMAAALPQMKLYAEIGRLVSNRPEKGTAIAAAEYLCIAYPDASGFSPRNLRRMREFYRTYENNPEVLAGAMTIGWTQNVVILEATLTLQAWAWYIWVTGKFGWSKLELQRKVNTSAHMDSSLDFWILRVILKKILPQRSRRKHGKRGTQWQTKSRSAGRGSTT